MSFPVPGPQPESREFEVPEDDLYPAVIVAVWHVGVHRKEYAGEVQYVEEACVCYQIDGLFGPIYLYDRVKIPKYWPSSKSKLWNIAQDALGFKRAEAMKDFWDMVGHGVLVETVQNADGSRAYVKRTTKLPSSMKAPSPSKDFKPSEPEGLAKWLVENQASKKEVESFSAPVPGADDTSPDDIPF